VTTDARPGFAAGGKQVEVVVVGGANMDLHARADRPVEPGTSTPGTSALSPGGVGRNIAENLARLGVGVALVSVVGDDPIGDDVIGHTEDAGVDCSHVRRRGGVRTGTYNAILDVDGELVAAVADMAATDEVSPLVVEAARELMTNARAVIVDGNVPAPTVGLALDMARAAGIPAAFDPVSVAKAERVADQITPERAIFLVTPNLAELAALTGLPTGTDAEVRKAVQQLHERGVDTVWTKLGARGSVLSFAGGYEHLPALPGPVVDVTGAGDAMLAGFGRELLHGAEPLAAARYGHAAAALTLATDDTVRPDLTDALVRSLV